MKSDKKFQVPLHSRNIGNCSNSNISLYTFTRKPLLFTTQASSRVHSRQPSVVDEDDDALSHVGESLGDKDCVMEEVSLSSDVDDLEEASESDEAEISECQSWHATTVYHMNCRASW
jgi:hypothetical protein